MERIGAEVRLIDATFVAALVFALRGRGFRVSPPDAWACVALARSKAGWKRAEIASVLSTALVRRPGEAAIFDQEFGRLFDRDLPTSTLIRRQVQEQQASDNATTPEPRLRRFVRRGSEIAGQAGRGLSHLWDQRVRGVLERLRHAMAIGAAIVSALAGVYLIQSLLRHLALYVREPILSGSPTSSTGSDLLVPIDAAIAAVSLTGFGLRGGDRRIHRLSAG